MSTFVKKILVSAVAAIVLATIAMPPAAQAQTAADLQAQIQSLLAQIAALQAQLSGATGGGGIAGIPAGFTFTQNLSQGSSGIDVTHLQHLLNSNPSTRVASSGAGSPGSETQFFGPLTATAVSAFQNMYASSILTPLGLSSGTGFFGASTRAKANMMIASGVMPMPSPTPGTPSPMPTPTPGISTPGVEGSLIATIMSSPASGATLNLNESKAVTAVETKATGSDILVSRFDLEFDVRPWLYISDVTISDGTTSRTKTVTSANTTEVTVGSKYSFRVDGLNILVPKDTTKTLTVTVKAQSGLPAGTTTKDLVLSIIAEALRGTDGAGLTQTAPTAVLATRTFTVKEGDTASLELSASTNNPKARPVIVQSTTETADVVLAVFSLKATGNAAILRTLEFKDSIGSGTLDVVTLYDGNTALGATSSIAIAASSVISNVNLTIPKDTTKTLTLKGTIKKAQGNYESAGSSTIDAGAASSSITISADKTSISAEDATSFAAATVTGSDVTPQAAYFYLKAPTLALVSTSITGLTAPSGSLTPQQAEAKIRVNITANGGDIYIPHFDSAQSASNGIFLATSSISASTNFSGEAVTSNAEVAVTDDLWVVRSGDTKWFEWSGIITDATGASEGMSTTGKSVAPQFTDLRWGTTQAAGLGNGLLNWEDTDFWTSYKTSSIFVQSPN